MRLSISLYLRHIHVSMGHIHVSLEHMHASLGHKHVSLENADQIKLYFIMKTLDFDEMEVIVAGDDLDDFVGGLACGAAIGSLFVNPFLAFIPIAGCANYLRKQ